MNISIEKKVFCSLCGEDECGNSKAMVAITMSDTSMHGTADCVLDKILLDTPIVNIYRSGTKTTVDLTFISSQDYNLINTVGRLNDFIKTENESPNDEVFRNITVTLIPANDVDIMDDFNNDIDIDIGSYFVVGMFGTYILQPSVPGGDIDTIRFIFDTDLFYTMQMKEELEEESEYGTK